MTDSEKNPLVSCIMPTADRRQFVARAVEYFLRQDYESRELIVVDDGREAVGDLIPADGRVRYVRLDKKLTVGAKRNLACEQARGEVVAHWDDDDWHAPRRLSYQVEALLRESAEVCGISTLLFYDAGARRGWQYVYPPRERLWLSGSTLCYRRAFWARNRFAEINVGEDARFVWGARAARMHVLRDSTFHVGIIHPTNVSPKRTSGAYWKPYPPEKIRELLGCDAEFYDRLRDGAAEKTPSVTAATKSATKSTATKSTATKTPAATGAANANTSTACDAQAAACDARATADARPASETVRAAAAAKGSSVSPSKKNSRAALVSAAYGVGDILRVTPLVGALARLGYEVDVLVAPDYAETATLLEGAAEIRRLFVYENFRATRGHQPVAGLDGQTYELATFTVWSAPLKRWVRAARTFEFQQREWLREGDAASVERIARAVGWEGALPEPFAVASRRRFDLPPNTVALHPGCKPDWPWKKWHGFGELARLFPSVVVVGTESDLRNGETYFRHEFDWPEHAVNFAGRLSLRDTAALVAQSAALVANDSGLMHLGVAVGTPTFGIFGITSPQREAARSPKMFAVTKGLTCEPACRRGAWGRRDCERHLECLKTLTAREVYARVTEQLPELVEGESAAAAEVAASHVGESRAMRSSETRGGKSFDTGGAKISESRAAGAAESGGDDMNELSLIYYGYVFDASGYGQAARAYIHALASAGVRLSVVPLANRPRQVRDALVESLVGRQLSADFHLFHGIPPQWAARAFPLRNAIGMTVWETDAMPSQWRNALNHVLEVWLPCEHNVTVFRQALEKPVFKLPHPLLPAHTNGDRVSPSELLGVTEKDFVFYSIFEWQQRKSPHEMIETYLGEFAGEATTVLVLKTNPGAAAVAARAVEQARERTRSRARVQVRAEGWSVAEIEALHERGDCYVSLHRGEGWGYPLFEAAARGTPVVATEHSGPLEYLSPEAHGLVRCRAVEVRQLYLYYTPRMSWAEPDFAHAAEQMRRIYGERDAARERAARAAARLRENFSLAAVGQTARAELLRLLQQTKPEKWARMARAESAQRLTPPAPIPADWYDADYFEHGLKSNWERGYTWPLFSELFREAAGYLTEMFPEAESFLDAGCAKGFLVRSLRERGKECLGFDHSPHAVSQVDEETRPFVTLAGADEVNFEREFDVLLAFSLFESLTEEQIKSFLARARKWTRQALCATIPSFASRQEEESYARDDRDFSHITMRPRRWWHETFLAAGWRQDALHRIVERACQSHGLPQRMGWKVYVYAPR